MKDKLNLAEGRKWGKVRNWLKKNGKKEEGVVNKSRIQFFEKINKIDISQAKKQTITKREREMVQITNTRDVQKKKVTVDIIDIL